MSTFETVAERLTFTGERVVPGSVDPDLWNEHVSRYRFACRFALEKKVLDLGCGTGYGAELLSEYALHVTGVDSSAEAIAFAAASFPKPDFLTASGTELPFPSGSFELVTAFELIEHLSDWRLLLFEAARVLAPEGIFLVSTPNKEFELGEFRQALARYFPFIDAPVSAESHFFIAVRTQARESQRQFDSLLEAPRKLHDELDAHNARALRLHDELIQARIQIRNKDAELAQMQAACHGFEVRLQAAQQHNDNLSAQLEEIRKAAWIRLGRILKLGPFSNRRLRASVVTAFLRDRSTRLWRLAKGVAAYVSAFLALLTTALVLLVVDLAFSLIGKRRLPADTEASHESASIIIPNWNGCDLLARSLGPLLKAVDLECGNEIIVVDNASTDGSVAFIREQFPQVRVHQLTRNEGFAGAANAGVAAARNKVVVLLNNDMHVRSGFLKPLLQHFADPLVFAASSQIFFSDPQRRREETGLTEAWWENGTLRVGHRIDPDLNVAYPCAYPGGGSSAFHRGKFLELGGFDALFHPFYYEDTDLGRLAWKRGWKVLYEPTSVVFHEHRGTIGKKFSTAFIDNVVRKNAILYCWKNIHDWRLLLSHFRASLFGSSGASPSRPGHTSSAAADILRAFRQLPAACRSRWRALSLKAVSDREAFLRPLGGYFRDRFLAPSAPVPARLNVLFVSPYPIEPPVHGGAVFMKETLAPLSSIADVHLLSFLDNSHQLAENQTLSDLCKTAQFMVRPHFPIDAVWTLTPAAVREFAVREFAWLIQRSIYLHNIDVLQLEYTVLGQYAGKFHHIPCFLFEHDISVQSLQRRLNRRSNLDFLLEYARMRYYEPRLLKRLHRIQVCSAENAKYLLNLAPSLRGRVDSNVRAAIDTRRYPFVPPPRLPNSLLFLGSFRHTPNLEALRWFTQEVFPKIIAARPSVTLNIVGSDPPQSSTIWNDHPQIRLLGAVPDIREPLQRFAVFICPIRSGSGVRVKLLEAFASGIPAVSTSVGAEGLAATSGEVCELADHPDEFAAAVLHLLESPSYCFALATRAREMVERQRDSSDATSRLASIYRAEVESHRSSEASVVTGLTSLEAASNSPRH